MNIRSWSESVYIAPQEPLSRLRMDPVEYENRKAFCEDIKTMERSAHVEIARILRKYNFPVSENRSGIFFDMVKLPDEVFNALLQFRDFVNQNTQELDKREVDLKA